MKYRVIKENKKIKLQLLTNLFLFKKWKTYKELSIDCDVMQDVVFLKKKEAIEKAKELNEINKIKVIDILDFK